MCVCFFFFNSFIFNVVRFVDLATARNRVATLRSHDVLLQTAATCIIISYTDEICSTSHSAEKLIIVLARLFFFSSSLIYATNSPRPVNVRLSHDSSPFRLCFGGCLSLFCLVNLTFKVEIFGECKCCCCVLLNCDWSYLACV